VVDVFISVGVFEGGVFVDGVPEVVVFGVVGLLIEVVILGVAAEAAFAAEVMDFLLELFDFVLIADPLVLAELFVFLD
jgi:hypothetical protein